MEDQSKNVIVLLEYRLKQAEEHIDLLELKIEGMKSDARRREEKRLLWGISALGSVVMAMGSLIWAYRGVIFK